VAKAVRSDTFLVSCTAANHEVGTLQPIREIARVAHEKGALFHTDAVQAFGKVPLHVDDGFDYLTASAHKFYGPKGAGFVYQRKDAPLVPLLHGGGQERWRRGGTENVPAIVGMSEAAVRAVSWMADEAPGLEDLVTILVEGLRKRLPDLVVNGPYDNAQGALFDRGAAEASWTPRRLPGLINIGVPGVEGDNLAHSLDTKGFAVSTGPACSTGVGGPSKTLAAMGRDKKAAREGLRISLGRSNTEVEVRQLVEVLPLVVERLRMLSPLLGD
jgi:cysteine desulfurase